MLAGKFSSSSECHVCVQCRRALHCLRIWGTSAEVMAMHAAFVFGRDQVKPHTAMPSRDRQEA